MNNQESLTEVNNKSYPLWVTTEGGLQQMLRCRFRGQTKKVSVYVNPVIVTYHTYSTKELKVLQLIATADLGKALHVLACHINIRILPSQRLSYIQICHLCNAEFY